MASEPVDSFIPRLKEFIYTSTFEGEVVNEFMKLIAEIYREKEQGTLSKTDLGRLQKQANLAFLFIPCMAMPLLGPGFIRAILN